MPEMAVNRLKRSLRGFYLRFNWFPTSLFFGGPNYHANSRKQEYNDSDRYDQVYLGGAFVDINERLIGGLWFECHGMNRLRVDG